MSASLGLARRQAGRMILRHQKAAAAAGRRAPAAPSSARPSSPHSPPVVAARAAKLIDGKQIAADIRQEIAAEVAALKQRTGGRVPGLAVVLVGERKDSQSYVRSKKKACAEVGFDSFGLDLPETATEEEVLAAVAGFNADPRVHGVLVQLPLPKHVDERRVLDAVSVRKDVDGFHPVNIGALAMRGREPLYVPCTPKGCIELLERSGVRIAGATAAVVGRSNIVGLPAALLLQNRDATVTVVHSRTPDPQAVVREADIVIAACGKAEMVTGDWIKPGAVVIDVGINAVPDATKKAGHRLVGDVHFASAAEKASMITPVPGGVGPMTIAMLLRNTLDGAKRELLGGDGKL
jgi:5,10-methylene-tetrahydrofolate dehydrogenase/methenyl tetrahydrofolate cyclohydrolase